MNQNRAGADRPWLREGASSYQRAIALIDNAVQLGLSGTVLGAAQFRIDLIAAIDQHATERATEAERRAREAESKLEADGYRRCCHCLAWTFADDAIALTSADGSVCSSACRDAVEPLCACGCGNRYPAESELPENCARRIADDLRADEEVA